MAAAGERRVGIAGRLTITYRIRADADRRLLTITLSGFLSAEEAQDFVREEQAAVRAAGWSSGSYRVLVDTRECMLQLQEVVARLKALVTASPLQAERIALVNGQSAFRMQGRRILDRADARIFDTAEEAEDWLLAD